MYWHTILEIANTLESLIKETYKNQEGKYIANTIVAIESYRIPYRRPPPQTLPSFSLLSSLPWQQQQEQQQGLKQQEYVNQPLFFLNL